MIQSSMPMHVEQYHCIQRYRIELKLGNEKSAYKTEQRFLSAAKRIIAEELADLFDEVIGEQRYLIIEKIEIDLGTIHESMMEETIYEKVPAHIREELKKSLSFRSDNPRSDSIDQKRESYPSSHSEVLENTQYIFLWFVFFLRLGRFPWWAPPVDFHSFETELIRVFHETQNGLSYHLKELLKQGQNTVERLSFQFSEDFLVELISFLTSGKKELVFQTIDAVKATLMENMGKTDPGQLKKGGYLPIFKSLSSLNYHINSHQDWLRCLIDHLQHDQNRIVGIDVLRKLCENYQNANDLNMRNMIDQLIDSILYEESGSDPSTLSSFSTKSTEKRHDPTRLAQKKQNDLEPGEDDLLRLNLSKDVIRETTQAKNRGHESREVHADEEEINRGETKEENQRYDDREAHTNEEEIKRNETKVKNQRYGCMQAHTTEKKIQRDETQKIAKDKSITGMKTGALNTDSEKPLHNQGIKSGEIEKPVYWEQEEKGNQKLEKDNRIIEPWNRNLPAGKGFQKPSIFKIAHEDPHYYIHNAGLVILAPFFPSFFQELKLLKDNDFKDSDAACRAVHILQHAIDESESPPENELILNKILAGIPIEEPLERDIILTHHEKECIDNLLTSVITHWSALKGASANGLQEGFLQRQGKLSFVENGWKLIVERKTIDILLSRMPWGFSMIHLPWMHSLLYVEW
ncbi:MAG: contractile injection system tape measure protein [Thermodesulfobacteriota bacterium]|nr:contractile injection system tape measure protein [Thermodesulfobacteriota bacterium]